MIQANELRIGNYVLINGKFCKTEAITGCMVSVSGYEINRFKPFEFKHLEPIQLTEEILLKCGFEKKQEWYRHNEMKKYTIESGVIDLTKGRYHIRQYISKDKSLHLSDLKYLHQLQNLYFALTGKELIIKP